MKDIPPATEEPEFFIDAELPHKFVTPQLVTLCHTFEPYGEDNAPLMFYAKKVPMVDAQIVGKNGKSHLKLTLDFGTYKWPAMLWDGAQRLERDFSFKNRDKVGYPLQSNHQLLEWRGTTSA